MKGFYIIQLVNKDIKIETISYLDTIDKFEDVNKMVFICESISDVIKRSINKEVSAVTTKVMHMANFKKFNRNELKHIHNLIYNLVADYLK